ncbi:MAG TPA: hypothetical protein DCE42_03630 [Myxococcales bacterium]|nr:hypothetical protein [Myxococcales bacterium]
MMQQSCPHCHQQQDVSRYAFGETHICTVCGGAFYIEQYDAQSPMNGNLALAPRPTRVVNGGRQAKQAKALDHKAARLEEVRKARRPNLVVEGYDIKECRGRGGMGQVYRAVQKSLGREVAIKTLDASLARNQASVMRFTKEAAAMARLRHPNIVHVIDRGRVGSKHYFIMEFVDGPSLRDLLQDGAFSPPEALRIMLQIARTMEYAHGEGVIHRDLKPENILYTNAGVLKVADFGLAGVNQETTHIRKLTKSFVSMGTECYMAPEQRRDAKNVDMRADIYSSGVIFYELVTNQLPLIHVPKEKGAICPDNQKLEDVIRRCLEPTPDKRYANTTKLCEAIEEVIATLDQSKVPTPRDTVIDTPAAVYDINEDDPISFGNRLSLWPNRLHSSISDFASHWTTSWQRPAIKRMFWSGGLLAGLGLAVGIFFILSPRPPQPKSLNGSEAGPSWYKQPAQAKQLSAHSSALRFDFAQRALHTNWGRHPRPQWSLKGNWSAIPGVLTQNTYKDFFVRNHRNCWATYTGHILSPKAFEVSADAQFQPPTIPHKGRKLDLNEYIQRVLSKSQRFTRYPTIGVGVRGFSGGEISFLLRPKAGKFSYVLRMRGNKVNGKTQPYRYFKGDLRHKIQYDVALKMSLQVESNKASIAIGKEHIKDVTLQPNEIFPSHGGFICRDAFCKFSSPKLTSYAFRRRSS